VVKADPDTFEPLAARLRRCDGDTGPQRARLPSKGGVRLRSGSPVPQAEDPEGSLASVSEPALSINANLSSAVKVVGYLGREAADRTLKLAG
jgi:hypothetical protein